MYALPERFISNLLGMRRFLFCAMILYFPSVLAAEKAPDASTDDDVIVIEDENAQEKIPEKKESFLEKLKENVVFRSDIFLQGSYQLVNPSEKPLRSLGSFWATLGYEPSATVSLQLSAIARVPIEFSFAPGQFSYPNPFIDFYDSFIKIRSSNASLSMGYLLIPWVNTRGAAVLDRLNPVDYRRGQDFTSTILGRIPQVGAYYQTSVLGMSIDTVILLHYSPSLGSLVASEQSGVQIGHYQGALVQNQTQIDGFLPAERQDLWVKQAFLQTPVLAIRAQRQLGDTVDMGISISAGFNEVPSLRLPGNISQFLAERYFDSLAPTLETIQSLRQSLNTSGALFHERLLGFGFNLNLNLGAVVLKSEILAEPNFSDWGGKTTIMVSKTGVRSLQLPSLTIAVAADGEYGDWFSGSLELIDTIWFAVPKGEYVLGVESLNANISSDRVLHRLAFAAATQGAFLNQKILVRVKGEVGLIQPDVLARIDASYHWESLGLYAGAYSNLFFGIKGSPGWLRQDATSFGLYVGHKI